MVGSLRRCANAFERISRWGQARDVPTFGQGAVRVWSFYSLGLSTKGATMKTSVLRKFAAGGAVAALAFGAAACEVDNGADDPGFEEPADDLGDDL